MNLKSLTYTSLARLDLDSDDLEEIHRTARELSALEGITGLLVHSDPEAMAFVDLALTRGISIPEDLSIIAYDDEVAGLFSPALTAVRPPRRSIGRAAVRLATDRIADPRRPTHRIMISPSLRIRDSVSQPRR